MIKRLLVANRGEVAIRILRAAAEINLSTVAIAPQDDSRSLHLRYADVVRELPGSGPAAYLDVDQIIDAAQRSSVDAVHPGYGFLSENAEFARRCAAAGMTFVGPTPEHLALFGDKARVRSLAVECGVPVLAGTMTETSLDEALEFFDSLGARAAIMVKAVAGGGGRGIRLVRDRVELEAAYRLCEAEARAAFGDGRVYVEQALLGAQHIEIQLAGDGQRIEVLGERDCSLQRRNQKIVEIAPSPWLTDGLRLAITEAAGALAEAVGYSNLGTFEFLVDRAHRDGSGENPDPGFYFMEANPRLQVEHTVTEEHSGLDLVALQLGLAAGESLTDLLPAGTGRPRCGFVIQARVNMEQPLPDGTIRPGSGVLARFEPPTGPGVRVDTFGYPGYETSPNYDSLLAKVIVRSAAPEFDRCVDKAARALQDFVVAGVPTNIGFLRALLAEAPVRAGELTTRYVDENLARIAAAGLDLDRSAAAELGRAEPVPPVKQQFAGGRVDQVDPLAVLDYGLSGLGEDAGRDSPRPPEGQELVTAGLGGTVVSVDVGPGDLVRAGQQMIVLEAMKMQHPVTAGAPGVVVERHVDVGDTVHTGHLLFTVAVSDGVDDESFDGNEIDLDLIRPDLAEVFARRAYADDENRLDATARRAAKNARTARENVAALVDEGSFVEYGRLVVAAQHDRRSSEELRRKTPADGVITGLARINGEIFGSAASQCSVVAFDDSVLAGTLGLKGHEKLNRCFELAARTRRPVVLFGEGGGGRAGDTDLNTIVHLDVRAYYLLARLSGLVPLIGIASGRCFAAHAGLLGVADVIIATRNSNIGMGGPAMIEGGGLGVYRPEEIGPASVQTVNGVIDVLVADETEAVEVARKYLGYFQGTRSDWSCADQRAARHIVPEDRLRGYDVRRVIDVLADTDSVLELRPSFGVGMVTALIRVEGRPLGVVANNPMHMGGAIDSTAADKAARFLQVCEAFDLPILMLCDTPGIIVGPEAEKEATVRKSARMFVTGANLTVPTYTIVLRKAYGLGAELMSSGAFGVPQFTISWPTGEMGGMGLEGQVKLSYRNELAAIADVGERRRTFDELVDKLYEQGHAVNVAAYHEFDDVIDPAESRTWITAAMSTHTPSPRRSKTLPYIDTW